MVGGFFISDSIAPSDPIAKTMNECCLVIGWLGAIL